MTTTLRLNEWTALARCSSKLCKTSSQTLKTLSKVFYKTTNTSHQNNLNKASDLSKLFNSQLIELLTTVEITVMPLGHLSIDDRRLFLRWKTTKLKSQTKSRSSILILFQCKTTCCWSKKMKMKTSKRVKLNRETSSQHRKCWMKSRKKKSNQVV